MEETKEKRKKNWLVILILILLALIAIYFIFFRDVKNNDEEPEELQEEVIDEINYSSAEKWAEGVISFDGKQYIYNKNLKNYLFMGIDKTGVVEEAEDYQSGGQSDAMFLVVTDPDTMKMKIVTINRNTMTEVKVFDKDGTSLGNFDAQICVAHGYGDGKRLSCNLAEEAVEKLFYNLQIDGYLALNVDGVALINDFVGGVELEVEPGLEYLADKRLQTGNRVVLTGEEAIKYLRYRDTKENGSADLRLNRQQQYIGLFMPLLTEKISSESTAALNLYNIVSDYLVTNIDAESLINDLAKYEYDPDETYSVPGETVYNQQTDHDEYIVNQDEFYKLIIDIFYIEYK